MAHTTDLDEIQRRKQQYYYLMQETRWRLDSIALIEGQLGKSLNTLQHFIANETYLLQLRMIFESIALGCMIVHGDIPATKVGKAPEFYQADAILKVLSKGHADFFPVPINISPNPDGSGTIAVAPRSAGPFLTKDEVTHLYRKYGDYLHRGRMVSFVEKQHDALKPLGKEIGDMARKCIALLNGHQIRLYGTPNFLACVLYPTVEVQYFKPADPFPIPRMF
jgi:hypothetical protein